VRASGHRFRSRAGSRPCFAQNLAGLPRARFPATCLISIFSRCSFGMVNVRDPFCAARITAKGPIAIRGLPQTSARPAIIMIAVEGHGPGKAPRRGRKETVSPHPAMPMTMVADKLPRRKSVSVFDMRRCRHLKLAAFSSGPKRPPRANVRPQKDRSAGSRVFVRAPHQPAAGNSFQLNSSLSTKPVMV